MKAIKIRTRVRDGKIVIPVPKEFGEIVEVILLENKDYEFWDASEIKNFGKNLNLKAPLDDEDFSQW